MEIEPNTPYRIDGDLLYNTETEEGEVFFSTEFMGASAIVKKDILSDWINDLTRMYNSINIAEDLPK